MNFNLGESNFNFPEVKLDTQYEDDDFKLHSDLVGVDFNNYLANNSAAAAAARNNSMAGPAFAVGPVSSGSSGRQRNDLIQGSDSTADLDAAELLHMSLPLYDPRKSKIKQVERHRVRQSERKY